MKPKNQIAWQMRTSSIFFANMRMIYNELVDLPLFLDVGRSNIKRVRMANAGIKGDFFEA